MRKALRALLVEDSERDVELLLSHLRRSGYDVSYQRVETAAAMRDALSNHAWDLVLADYRMPQFTGLLALAVLRETGIDIPFIIVSGTVGEEAAVETLKSGAHDFLVKDRLARLVPAIERELREADVRRERRKATALLDNLYETAPIGLAFFDRDLRYVRINEFLAAIHGVPAAAHVGRHMRDILPLLAPPIEETFRTMLETKEPVLNVEMSGETPAMPGQRRHWLVSHFPVFETGDVVLGIGSIVVDITDRERAQAEREHLLAELKQAVQARDEFLSIASHELKTPITSLALQVTSLLAVIRSRRYVDIPVEKLESKLELAARQIDRLTVLINNLLDVTRLTSGRLTIDRTSVNLGELVETVIASTRSGFRASKSEVRFRAEAGVIGLWDPSALETVIGNLFLNALKYGEEKPIEITVDRDGGSGRLVVVDHGIGIAPEEQKRIFERFERAVPTEHYGGFGIGLWAATKVVEAHGGTIRVSSSKGLGSTFIVDLPLALEGGAP